LVLASALHDIGRLPSVARRTRTTLHELLVIDVRFRARR